MKDKSIISRSKLHEGHRVRVRKDIREHGLRRLNDHQLLEFILFSLIARKDTNDLAHILINKFGSLKNVLNAPYNSLLEVDGLGEVSATFLSILPEMIDIISDKLNENELKIQSSVQAVEKLKPLYKTNGLEKIIIILLNKRDGVIKYVVTDFGDELEIGIFAKYLRNLVITHNAAKVILSHNHTNGVCQPSEEDVTTTKQIFMLLHFMQVELVDHIILSGEDYYSFRANGDIGNFRKLISFVS